VVECELFVLPYNWMGDIKSEEGEIKCFHCSTQLGNYKWEGLPCTCGLLCKPAFIVHKSAVITLFEAQESQKLEREKQELQQEEVYFFVCNLHFIGVTKVGRAEPTAG
jgi:hypothetical protein